MTMRDIKAAVVQMSSVAEPEPNMAAAEKLVAAAASDGAELVALPEFFGCMSANDEDKLSLAESDSGGPTQDFLAELAARLGVYLVGGTIPLRSDVVGKVSSTSILFGPDGKRLARYDKMHLFRYASADESHDESRIMVSGTEAVAVDTDIGRIGLSVCYDLRFPELYRAMRQPDIIVAPSAFTRPTGRCHWSLLLRARAVENLAYVLAPAQCGTHPGGRKTWGESMIVGPWGDILETLGTEPGWCVADLCAANLAMCRERLPALSDRIL